MTDETTEKPTEYAVIQSYTLYLPQVARLSELQQKTGLKRSDLVRRAIDRLYAEIVNVEADPT